MSFTLKKSEVRYQRSNKGFTLIELLVVIAIIGILMGLSIFGLIGARESARDARRKADLEQIRSGVEVYKADCNKYPTTLGATLVGNGSVPTCPTTNVYMSTVPVDPLSPARSYSYYSFDGSTYEVCASLEVEGPSVTCGGSSACGGSPCNYKVVSP